MAGTYKEDSDFQAASEAFDKGQFTEAMKLLTKVADRYPNEAEVQQRIGLCSFERAMQRMDTDTSTPADWRSVIDALESVAASGHTKQIASSLSVAYHNLGVCLNQQEDFEEAGEHFRRALAINPEMIDASISLAINHADIGDGETAEQLLREVIERSPGELQARLALGLILSAQGKDSEAVEQFKRAQPPERDNASVHYSRGVSYLNLGELDEADAAFRQTLELNPEFAPAQYNLGLILREQGDLSGAERCFEEVTRLEPDSPGGHFCLASLYEKRDLSLAISTWEKYLEVAAKLPSEAEMVAKAAGHVAALKKKAEEPQEET